MNSTIKAQLFAKYLNQRVFDHSDYTNPMSRLQPGLRVLNFHLLSGNYPETGWLELRTVSMLTDEEIIHVAQFAHQMPKSNFKVIRNNGIIHAEHVNRVGIKSHISLYGDYGSVNANTHFLKTETEPFKTYKTNIGEINMSSRLPIPYIAICDYLRSIGVALPITVLQDDKPLTLSVSEMVEKKWIVIKEK